MIGAYLGPRLPAARAPAWRATHHARQGAARSAPESPGVASARSTMSTASSLRSERPGLAHLVATLGQGCAKMVKGNGNAPKQEQKTRGDQHRNARVSLQRPSWCLYRGPARQRELENRVFPSEQRALSGHTVRPMISILGRSQSSPSIAARIYQAAVSHEPPRS